MPFYQAVAILRRQDRQIKGVQVWYSHQVMLCTVENDTVFHPCRIHRYVYIVLLVNKETESLNKNSQ